MLWSNRGLDVCRRIVAGALLAALAVFGVTALAADDDELPGRVGRIADVAGEVFFSPQDRPDVRFAAGINDPVTSGDNLWVAGDGRAEVDYGGGQFRLAGDTSLHVSRLDDRQLALFVAQGRLIVRVRDLDRGEVATIDAPNTQVQLTRPGLYRVDVSADRSTTTVVVREGEALAAIAGGAQQILPGQTAFLTGAKPERADVRSGTGSDGFDAWSASRDRRYERGRSASYVSRQMVGWVDLDEYGTWDTHPTYGAIWYPTSVAVGWAPYRHGRWTHVGRWGWTWVDDAPWGYAPFHYGRWVWIGRWAWCPGAYVARPVWAPAVVGWYGGNRGTVSVSVGAPVYGWVPLGWGDPFIPWWGRGGCGQRCWAHYNRPYAVPYVVDRAERPHAPPTFYSNARVPGAITAVAGTTMAAHRPVGANVVALPAGGAHAPVMSGAPPLKPLRLPDARPVPGAPAPASTFYPTTRPRLLVNPSPGSPSARTADRERPALHHPALQHGSAGGQPPSSPPPTSAPPSGGDSRPGPGRALAPSRIPAAHAERIAVPAPSGASPAPSPRPLAPRAPAAAPGAGVVPPAAGHDADSRAPVSSAPPSFTRSPSLSKQAGE